MTHQRLRSIVFEEVRRSPRPRGVPWLRLMISAYRDPSTLVVIGLSALGGVAVAYAVFVPMADSLRPIAVAITGLLTLGPLLLPATNAFHYASILRRGEVSPAEVLAVTYLDPRQVLGRSIDELRNGVAAGELLIMATGDHVAFESDEAGASEIHLGTVLTAVIDPEKAELLFLIGDASGTNPVLVRRAQ